MRRNNIFLFTTMAGTNSTRFWETDFHFFFWLPPGFSFANTTRSRPSGTAKEYRLPTTRPVFAQTYTHKGRDPQTTDNTKR